MLRKEALEYLVEEVKPLVEIEKDGVTYTTQPLYQIKSPVLNTIRVNTLTGLVDYLNSKFDDLGKVCVNILTPQKIEVFKPYAKDKQRDEVIIANANVPYISIIEERVDIENFIVQMQSVFVSTEDSAKLIKLVSNIKVDNGGKIEDNGYTQTVTAKTGVATVAQVEVPNPVNLKPFRTFTEVNQPEVPFVFRIKKYSDSVSVRLYEADGGAWKNEAIENIKQYLLEAFKDNENIVVIG